MSNYPEEENREPQLQWLENAVNAVLQMGAQLVGQLGRLILSLLRS